MLLSDELMLRVADRFARFGPRQQMVSFVRDLLETPLDCVVVMDPNDVRRRLSDQRRAVLGARPNLIRVTKDDIAFNPRDEDCVACIIEVADSDQPHMAGIVLSVEPRESAG